LPTAGRRRYLRVRVYAVVDIETTGGRFGEDRVTEVAVVLTDGERITDEWSTLVRPEVPIPGFITELTGIDEAMVADAPTFAEVAGQIAERTADRVFVAHNASFDYGFLRREFERCGMVFQRKRLCTVRVARKIFPGLPSYGLGRLAERLGIPLSDRHRAFGDARATALLLAMLVDNDRRGVIAKTLQHGSGERNLPPHLSRSRFLETPERTGVYYLLGERANVLYVGKARNLRARVAQHFAAAERNAREARMRHLVHDLRWEETGSELIALLRESIEIKRLRPPFNQAQTQWQANYGLVGYHDQHGYHRLAVVKSNGRRPFLLTFPDLLSARAHLERKVAEFGLCPRLASLQRGSGACHDRRARLCAGACEGHEAPGDYNARVARALDSLGGEQASALILGRGRHAGERSVVALENGHYLGYGYYDPERDGEDPARLRERVLHQPDNPDVQRILQTWLRGRHEERVLPLS
jgi:DNA polymerase-3 subunit epsilon